MIKKIGYTIITIILIYVGLIYLNNYLTPKFGNCYQNRNMIPHHHTGPCGPEKYYQQSLPSLVPPPPY